MKFRFALLTLTAFIALVGCDVPRGPETLFTLEVVSDGDRPLDAATLKEGSQILLDRIEEISQFDQRFLLVQIDADAQQLLVTTPTESAEAIRKLIGTMASPESVLELLPVHPDTDVLVDQLQGEKALGWTLYESFGLTEKPVLCSATQGLRNPKIKESHPEKGSHGGWQVFVTLEAEEGQKMRHLTSQQIGKRLAIVVDSKVLSSPTVNEAFGESFVVSGSFDKTEATLLAKVLRNGRMPYGVRILAETAITPEN